MRRWYRASDRPSISSGKSAAGQDARAALELMAIEIQMASYNPTYAPDIWSESGKLHAVHPPTRVTRGIQAATDSSITVEADINEQRQRREERSSRTETPMRSSPIPTMRQTSTSPVRNELRRGPAFSGRQPGQRQAARGPRHQHRRGSRLQVLQRPGGRDRCRGVAGRHPEHRQDRHHPLGGDGGHRCEFRATTADDLFHERNSEEPCYQRYKKRERAVSGQESERDLPWLRRSWPS